MHFILGHALIYRGCTVERHRHLVYRRWVFQGMARRNLRFVVAGKQKKCACQANDEDQSDDDGFDFRLIASHDSCSCAGLSRRLSIEIAGVFPAGQRMRRQVKGGVGTVRGLG